MEMRKLTLKDYDELLELLNHTFSTHYGRAMDFLNEQPKMWVKDDEHMQKHLGVFEEGVLAAVVGIYPLPAIINGTPVLFATTGNVATHPDYEGRGYFSKLFATVMQELDEIDADAARLGGARQRYGRFGFEPCGVLHTFTISEANRKKCYNPDGEINFVEVERSSTHHLKFIKELSERADMYIRRSDTENYRDVYLALCSKHAAPYVALKNGEPIGYLSAYADNQFVGRSANGRHIAEIRSTTPENMRDMALGWQKVANASVTLPIGPTMLDELRIFGAIAQDHYMASPSHFRFRRYENVADALMKLKAKKCDLPEGEFVIGIKDYASLCFYNRNGVAGCEKTAKAPTIELTHTEAQRLIFGPHQSEAIADTPWLMRAFLPLPLTWNTNDYV